MNKQGDFSFLRENYNEMMTELYIKFTNNTDLWEYLKRQNRKYDPMRDKYVLRYTIDLKSLHNDFTKLRCMLDIMYIIRYGWDKYVKHVYLLIY